MNKSRRVQYYVLLALASLSGAASLGLVGLAVLASNIPDNIERVYAFLFAAITFGVLAVLFSLHALAVRWFHAAEVGATYQRRTWLAVAGGKERLGAVRRRQQKAS